jgi:hypothetical protein
MQNDAFHPVEVQALVTLDDNYAQAALAADARPQQKRAGRGRLHAPRVMLQS